MRRRRIDPVVALTGQGIPLCLARYDPADWPVETAVLDHDGCLCAVPDEAHAACRFWAYLNQWCDEHPEIDLPLVSPGVDVPWHQEWI